MSTKGSKKKTKSPASGAAASPAAAAGLDDIDMASAGEASDSVGEFVPSTKIGSYLSQNYNVEVESKKVPGFICGQCYCLNSLKARESIRCRECGYRIMYKERLRRPMEYSAQ